MSKRGLFLILGILVFSTPSSSFSSYRQNSIPTLERKEAPAVSSSASEENDQGEGFDVDSFIVSGTGIAAVGGLGAASALFWKQKRKKTRNKPAKTVDENSNNERDL